MKEKIDKIVNELQKGNIVSFPTETVFALAADATNDEAVQKIFYLKNRDMHKLPLSIMVKDINEISKYAVLSGLALDIAKKEWPGPLTIILPQKPNTNMSKFVNLGQDTLGIRIPDHEIALQILKQFNKPIVATSVNLSGQPSAINYNQVINYFGDKVKVLENNDNVKGLESSIIKINITEDFKEEIIKIR